MTTETTVEAVPVIASAGQAVGVGCALAAVLAPGAIDRDRSGTVPADALAALDASGLLGITVPREIGRAHV